VEDLGAAGLVRVVRTVASLPHISLADQPAYEGTGVWVSHEQHFPGHLNQLREDWQRGRSAGLAAVEARRSNQRPGAKAKPRPKAKRRHAPLTDRELEALARQDAHARRIMAASEKRRRPRARAA
jgi:hypothetical protein